MEKQDPTPLPRLVVSSAQLKLMSFGPRRAIIAALANDPDSSARELASRLHRPVTGPRLTGPDRSEIAPGAVLVTGPVGWGMTCAPAFAEESFA